MAACWLLHLDLIVARFMIQCTEPVNAEYDSSRLGRASFVCLQNADVTRVQEANKAFISKRQAAKQLFETGLNWLHFPQLCHSFAQIFR